MKKYLILLFTVLTSLHVSAQSDGSQLWLGKQYANSCQVISQLPDDATAKIAKQELENNWRGKNVELKIDKALNLGEAITSTPVLHSKATTFSTRQLSPPAILSVCSTVPTS